MSKKKPIGMIMDGVKVKQEFGILNKFGEGFIF
jgi:hypothetical protein